MKIKYLIILLLMISSKSLQAQSFRYTDLNISIASPSNGFTVTSPGVDSCLVRIINNGPDELLKGDEVIITINFGGLRFVARSYPILKPCSKGDSIFYKCFFPAKGANDADSVELCVQEAYAYTPATSSLDTVLFKEKDSSRLFKDNSYCVVGFHRMARNSIVDDLESDDESMLVYPNPVHDVLTIQTLHELVDISHVEISLANGAVVYSSSNTVGSSSVQVDVTDFAPSLYLVKVYTVKGFFVKKIIKSDG